MASTTNTPSRINQLQSNCGAAHAAYTDNPPSISPRKPLPASPRKIRAGGKFQTRNPAAAAPRARGSQARSPCPTSTKQIAPARQTVTASRPAIPSMPSMKLYRFSSQTR
ncbi:hypothetical protein D3C81_2002770 [compost metagenome]